MYAIVRHALDEEGRLSVFLHSCGIHLLTSPVKGSTHDVLKRQFPLSLVKPVCPHRECTRILSGHFDGVVIATESEEVGTQRNHSHTGGKAAAEVALGDLPIKGRRRARIDEVPKHVEKARDGIVVLKLLVDLLVMERLQFPRLLIPILRLVKRRHAVHLRVK